MARILTGRKGINPYTRPVVAPGTGSNLVPSDYNSPSVIWRWNERDTSQIGAATCSTLYDPVAPAGTGFNTTNGGTFTAAASIIANGTGSAVGPRLRLDGTGANGIAPRPTNNQGGCILLPIIDMPLLPRRFVVNYRLCAINPVNTAGWGFCLYSGGSSPRVMGYIHNGASANVIVNRYDSVTPEAAGTYWPWASAANTRALPNVTNLTGTADAAGCLYSAEWNNYYDSTGANPPRGYCGPSARSNQAASAVANALIQTAGATTAFLGTTPGAGFNGWVGTKLGFVCRFPNPGNVVQTADFAEIYVTKHPMDQY
jgi:hypothetical protein